MTDPTATATATAPARAPGRPARRSRWSGLERRLVTVSALVLVNGFAIYGQAVWSYANLGRNVLVAAAFAATLESISLFLTSQASAALLANDKAAGLRLAAYAVALAVGAMNYNAHSVDWQPNPMAIAFGLLSTLSPWLWAIHARRTHRDVLAASGLIDPRMVKVPTGLMIFYPGFALSLLRLGVKNGINHLPTLRAMHAERESLRGLSGVDAVKFAFGALGSYHTHQARLYLSARGVHVKQSDLETASEGRPAAPVVAPATAPVAPTVTVHQDQDATAGRVAYSLPDGPDHGAALASLPSKRSKIKYAFAHIGRPAVAEAIAFLADNGVRVARSEVTTLASAVRSSGSTGEYPALSAVPNGVMVPFRPATAPAHLNGRTS